MPYSGECDAAMFLTQLKHGGSELTGAVGVTIETTCERTDVMAGGAKTPVCAPIDKESISVDARFMGLDSEIDTDVSAAAFQATFEEGDEGSATYSVGPVRACGVRMNYDRGSGAAIAEQRFKMEGSAIVKTVSV